MNWPTQGSGEMNVEAASSDDPSVSTFSDPAADSHKNIKVNILFEFPIDGKIYRKNNKCKENFYKAYPSCSQMSS